MTFVKICGITSVEDALACVDAGANLLGFIFAEESPRRVEISTVRHIHRIFGGDIKTVGVFTQESEDIRKIIDECRLNFAQLHGGQSEEFAARIGAERVIRVARVRDESSIDTLAEHSHAAFYLLDTYKKGVPGGTGETFNWELAMKAKSLGKPIFLSGGLTPENIADAIAAAHPFAVDISSGVEASPGSKDINKVKELINHVREADSAS